MQLKNAVEEFLLACGADGLKPKTQIWYTTLLRRFMINIPQHTLEKITVREMRQYIADLRSQQYSEDTIHGCTRGLHRFWKWCAKEYSLPNPMDNIAYPKQPKPKAPKAAQLDDIIKLLEACAPTPLGRRDKAIIAFLTFVYFRMLSKKVHYQ